MTCENRLRCRGFRALKPDEQPADGLNLDRKDILWRPAGEASDCTSKCFHWNTED